MLHLNDEQISDLLENKEDLIIQQMEDVFKDYHTGVAEMIPKTYLTCKVSSDQRSS